MVNIYCIAKSIYFYITYLLTIDIAKCRQYRIDIVSESRKWYGSITTV